MNGAAVDDEVAAALPCGAGRIVYAHRLDALGADVGLVGVAVTAHAAAGAAPAAAAGGAAGEVRALIGGDVQFSAVHGEGLLCLNAVGVGINVDGTAADGDVSLAVLVGIGLDAVPAGAAVVGVHRHGQGAVVGGIRIANAHGVVATDAVVCGVNGNIAVPDLQVILAHNAVLGVAVDDENALALELQVISGEDRTVDRVGVAVAVHIGVRVGGAVRDGVGGAALGGDLNLVPDRLHINRCGSAVGESQPLQIQNDPARRLCGLIHIDGKLSAGTLAADREFAGSGDGDAGTGDGEVRRIGQRAARCIGGGDAAAAEYKRRCHIVLCGRAAAAGQFLYAGELSGCAGHSKGAVVGTVVGHLRAAGVQAVAAGCREVRAACQHIGVLFGRCHLIDGAAAALEGDGAALLPLCGIVQLYHALGAAGGVQCDGCAGCIPAECVVRCRCQHFAAGDGECAVFVQREATVAAGGHRTAGDAEGSYCLYGIVARLDADFAGQNGHILLGGLQTVCGRSHGHRSTVYFQCIICPNGIGVRSGIDICVDADVAAVELDVVLGADAGVHAAGDVQRAGAVPGDGDVTVAVDDTAGISIGCRVGQRVRTAAGELQLLGALCQNARRTGGGGHGHIL